MNLEEAVQKKEIKNAGWLVGGKVFQMLLSLLVSVLTARLLKPDNYGLINYAAAYVAFFTSLCTLGINSVIIKDFVDNPDNQGITIGTTIVLRLISSTLSLALIVAIVSIVDKNEPITLIVAALSSFALLFQVFDTINYWFQNQYKSKITSIVTFLACLITSAYKIVLILLEKGVIWFAVASVIDYAAIAIMLLVVYKKYAGPHLKFSFKKSKELLSKSYHYILSGMMVAIYTQTDKIMLKQMMSEADVGYYSVATSICNMWPFVLAAIIDSVFPTIMVLYGKNKQEFEEKNIHLYSLVFYISFFVSICICIVSPWAIPVFYGDSYLPTVSPLRIITWYTAFAYLGVARNAWIVCEGVQKYLKYMYVGAAAMNVGLNFLLIPFYGASGAAFASLITQIFTCLLLPLLFKGMRRNAFLILKAISLNTVLWGRQTRLDDKKRSIFVIALIFIAFFITVMFKIFETL